MSEHISNLELHCDPATIVSLQTQWAYPYGVCQHFLHGAIMFCRPEVTDDLYLLQCVLSYKRAMS